MATYEDLMALGLALPSATEQVTWETAHTLRINGKIFAIGHPGSPHATVKATRQEQAELIAADPQTFAPASHVGRFGWLRVTLDRVSGPELNELLTEAWRGTAPRRLVKEFDAERG